MVFRMFLALFFCVAMLASSGAALAQTGGVGLPPEVASAGVTQAQWSAVRDEVRRQSNRARVSEWALLAAAEATGVRLVASGRFNSLTLQQAVTEALADQADQIADLQVRLDRLTGDADPAIASLFTQARAALEAGRLHEADRLLADVSSRDVAGLEAADADVERRRIRAGETMASRGQVAFLQADYLTAAEHFERAAQTVPDSQIAARRRYRLQQARALTSRGARFAEGQRLQQAIVVLERSVLPIGGDDVTPQDQAQGLYELGYALAEFARIGAESAPRAEIQLRASQLFLGSARQFCAMHDNHDCRIALRSYATTVVVSSVDGLDDITGSQNIEAAISSLEQMLADQSLDAEEHAHMQIVLGDFWSSYARIRGLSQQTRSAYLSTALDYYGRGVSSRELTDYEWDRTQFNVASALSRRCRFMRRTADCRHATIILSDLAASEIRDRSSNPAGWARVQLALGHSHLASGDIGSPRAYQDALASFERGLEVFTRSDAPESWADAKLGVARSVLGLVRAGDVARRDEGAAAATEAMSFYQLSGNDRQEAAAYLVLTELD